MTWAPTVPRSSTPSRTPTVPCPVRGSPRPSPELSRPGPAPMCFWPLPPTTAVMWPAACRPRLTVRSSPTWLIWSSTATACSAVSPCSVVPPTSCPASPTTAWPFSWSGPSHLPQRIPVVHRQPCPNWLWVILATPMPRWSRTASSRRHQVRSWTRRLWSSPAAEGWARLRSTR